MCLSACMCAVAAASLCFQAKSLKAANHNEAGRNLNQWSVGECFSHEY